MNLKHTDRFELWAFRILWTFTVLFVLYVGLGVVMNLVYHARE